MYAYLRMCIIICRNKKNFFFFIVRRVDSSMRNPWSRKSPPIKMRKVYRNWVYISESGPKRSARMETAERKEATPVCVLVRSTVGYGWRLKNEAEEEEEEGKKCRVRRTIGSRIPFTHGTIPIIWRAVIVRSRVECSAKALDANRYMCMVHINGNMADEKCPYIFFHSIVRAILSHSEPSIDLWPLCSLSTKWFIWPELRHSNDSVTLYICAITLYAHYINNHCNHLRGASIICWAAGVPLG